MTGIKLSEETQIEIKVKKAQTELAQIKVEEKERDVKLQEIVIEANRSGFPADHPDAEKYHKRLRVVGAQIEDIKLRALKKVFEIQELIRDQVAGVAEAFQGRVNAAMEDAKKKDPKGIIGPNKQIIVPTLRPMK